jgi:hypothetical protein
LRAAANLDDGGVLFVAAEFADEEQREPEALWEEAVSF